MKNLLFSVAAVALVAGFASNAKAEINPFESDKTWFVGGHAEAGIYNNEYWNDYSPMQNSRHDMQFNQGVLSFGKKLDENKTFDVGGRIDYMFGTDAKYFQSEGLEYGTGHGHRGWGTGDYYSALAQVYLEAKYDMVSVKAGKMLNPIGSNTAMSADRFFYSWDAIVSTKVATISGVVADVKINKQWSAFVGWGSYADETFESSENNLFIAGTEYKHNDKLSFRISALKGKLDKWDYNRNHTMVGFDANYMIDANWEYNFEFLYSKYKDNDGEEAREYVYANQLFYKINDEWKIGGRLEYVHMYDKPPLWLRGLGLGNDNYDYYALTVAANYTPYEWLVVKPEIRYDRLGSDKIFEDGISGKKDQISFGVSALVRF